MTAAVAQSHERDGGWGKNGNTTARDDRMVSCVCCPKAATASSSRPPSMATSWSRLATSTVQIAFSIQLILLSMYYLNSKGTNLHGVMDGGVIGAYFFMVGNKMLLVLELTENGIMIVYLLLKVH
ncbi:hypothetical protein ACQJBY_021674 [Aegilops geniculata]